DGEEISVDVRVVRPNGRVDRTGSAEVLVRPGETTKAPNVSMPGVKDNRPPTLIAPSKFEIKEGQTVDVKISVTDPDSNQHLQRLAHRRVFRHCPEVVRAYTPCTTPPPPSPPPLSPGFSRSPPAVTPINTAAYRH